MSPLILVHMALASPICLRQSLARAPTSECNGLPVARLAPVDLGSFVASLLAGLPCFTGAGQASEAQLLPRHAQRCCTAQRP